MSNFQLTQTGQEVQADLDLLDNNQATSGQVLTADGSGGASWQNASNKKYLHHLNILDGSSGMYATCYITSTRQSSISNTTVLVSELSKLGFDWNTSPIRPVLAYGGQTGVNNRQVIWISNVQTSGSTIRIGYLEYTTDGTNITINSSSIAFSSAAIYDTVTEI